MTDWTANAERGIRVQWSEEGRRRFPRRSVKIGTYLGLSRHSFVKVNWDGHSERSIDMLHPDFVEPVGNNGELAAAKDDKCRD